MNDLTLTPAIPATSAKTWKRAAYLLLAVVGVVALNILLYLVLKIPIGFGVAEFLFGAVMAGLSFVILLTEGKEDNDKDYFFFFTTFLGLSIVWSLVGLVYFS